jgi:hypothetical protein
MTDHSKGLAARLRAALKRGSLQQRSAGWFHVEHGWSDSCVATISRARIDLAMIRRREADRNPLQETSTRGTERWLSPCLLTGG